MLRMSVDMGFCELRQPRGNSQLVAKYHSKNEGKKKQISVEVNLLNVKDGERRDDYGESSH
ncbi:hypothetical protein AKJ43_01950 [candidate division MSBL1 archaeon SCGC-AAA261D19]|uniref:Uncharacterized protein n=1 Tax=candidate division MSBL1 archaeon SCGC-AAA261D19 TaxID=1698273 RepID=A0A133V7J2_9EURY|nr:hypothetical protein AKJ43_01950 [candidate division MSBL1 archaeon SCGC-AAA261D19]